MRDWWVSEWDRRTQGVTLFWGSDKEGNPQEHRWKQVLVGQWLLHRRDQRTRPSTPWWGKFWGPAGGVAPEDCLALIWAGRTWWKFPEWDAEVIYFGEFSGENEMRTARHLCLFLLFRDEVIPGQPPSLVLQALCTTGLVQMNVARLTVCVTLR